MGDAGGIFARSEDVVTWQSAQSGTQQGQPRETQIDSPLDVITL